MSINRRESYNNAVRDCDFLMSYEYKEVNTSDNLNDEVVKCVVNAYGKYQKRKSFNQCKVFETKSIIANIISFDSGEKLPSIRLDQIVRMRLVSKKWMRATDGLIQAKLNQLKNMFWLNFDNQTPLSGFQSISNDLGISSRGGATLANLPLNRDTINQLRIDRDLLAVWDAIVRQSHEDCACVREIAGRKITIRGSEMNAAEVREWLKIGENQELLGRISYLDLSKLKLLTLSPEILVHLKEVLALNLSSNLLQILPPEFCCLINLVTLDLGRNSLESLPDQMDNLVKLKNFNIPFNQLKSLPSALGRLTELNQILMNNNLLESVPEITDLRKLERVILNDNPLKVVPQFSHPPVELGIIRPTPYFTSQTKIIIRMREELAVEATTSLARLYQAIICSKDEMFSSIVDTLSEPDYERLCKMMVLCNGTSSVKKRNRNGIPKVSATNSQLRVLPKVGPHVFDLAVTRVIIEKYKELDPVIKKKVEDRIYMLAKTSLLEDFYKFSEKDQLEVRSQFAQSNLTRLANVLAEEEGSIKN